jgi:hypothetical protein
MQGTEWDVERMVRFKTFEDFHKFLNEYAYCSCLNCVGYAGSENCKQFVCMKTLSPVRFDMLHICAEWQDKDGRNLNDFSDKSDWKFSEKVAEKIEEMGVASFEEIKKVVESESE